MTVSNICAPLFRAHSLVPEPYSHMKLVKRSKYCHRVYVLMSFSLHFANFLPFHQLARNIKEYAQYIKNSLICAKYKFYAIFIFFAVTALNTAINCCWVVFLWVRKMSAGITDIVLKILSSILIIFMCCFCMAILLHRYN